MKKVVTLCVMMALAITTIPSAFAQAVSQAAASAQPVQAVQQAGTAAYNFGDFRSSTLTTKAWQSLNEKNLDAVLVYTNKCIELYAEKAREMQAALKDYPAGTNQEIFALWALNDIATSYYIQGEAYRQSGKTDKAKEAFEKVAKEFSFGQAWDPGQKSFWKPAAAAKDKLDMIAKGLNLDFGNMSSSFLATKAWEALAAKDIASVKAYVDKMIELYGDRAKDMQKTLTEYPWESKEKVFSYWALNDIGTGLFILGDAYRQDGKKAEATAAFQALINDYFYAQCWDPQGWFWKPAEAAQQKLIEMEATGK